MLGKSSNFSVFRMEESKALWNMCIISAFMNLRYKNHKFEATLGYTVASMLS